MKILLIFKDIAVECMNLFTKMSLKGREDNDLAPKLNDHYLHACICKCSLIEYNYGVKTYNFIKNEWTYYHKR